MIAEFLNAEYSVQLPSRTSIFCDFDKARQHVLKDQHAIEAGGKLLVNEVKDLISTTAKIIATGHREMLGHVDLVRGGVPCKSRSSHKHERREAHRLRPKMHRRDRDKLPSSCRCREGPATFAGREGMRGRTLASQDTRVQERQRVHARSLSRRASVMVHK